MRLIGNLASSIIGLLSVLGGIYYLAQAIFMPNQFRMADMNAIQATQVYSMFTYNAAVAIALFVLALVCVMVVRQTADHDGN